MAESPQAHGPFRATCFVVSVKMSQGLAGANRAFPQNGIDAGRS